MTCSGIKMWSFSDLLQGLIQPIFTMNPSSFVDDYNVHGEYITSSVLVDTTLYIGFDNGYIYGIDVNTSKLVYTACCNDSVLCFTNGSQDTMYVGCRDGTVHQFDYELKVKNVFKPFVTSENIPVSSLSLDSFGNWLICASIESRVLILISTTSIADNSFEPSKIIVSGKTNHVQFLSESIVSYSVNTIYYWNRDGTLQFKMTTNLAYITGMTCLNDGTLFVHGVNPSHQTCLLIIKKKQLMHTTII